MRVAIVTSEFYPRIGGIETYTRILISELVKHYKVGIVTGIDQSIMDTNTEHIGKLNLSKTKDAGEFNIVAQQLRSILSAYQPDIIHLISAGLVVYAKFIHDILPIIVTIHCKDYTQPWQKYHDGNVNEAINFGLSLCKKIICVSNYTKSFVANSYGTENVTVIHNGIAIPSKKRLHQKKKAHILTVARLIPRKGHIHLANALRHVQNHCQWDIVGEGYYENIIKEIVDDLPVNISVNFHGKVSPRTLESLFKNASIFAMTPIELRTNDGIDAEGFGLVYLEAASYYLPVIASKDSAADEIIDNGKSGFLVDPFNYSNTGAIIDDLITNRSKMSKMGYCAFHRIARKFTQAKSTSQLFEIYNDCSIQSGGSP